MGEKGEQNTMKKNEVNTKKTAELPRTMSGNDVKPYEKCANMKGEKKWGWVNWAG